MAFVHAQSWVNLEQCIASARSLGLAAVSLVGAAIMWHTTANRREVRAREQAEAQAREENLAKTHFYALLAHEVRTPLARISSALWLHQDLNTRQEKDEMLEIAMTSAKVSPRMVENP